MIEWNSGLFHNRFSVCSEPDVVPSYFPPRNPRVKNEARSLISHGHCMIDDKTAVQDCGTVLFSEHDSKWHAPQGRIF